MTPKASAQGTLAKTPFAHLLLFLHGKGVTGSLAVWPEQPSERQGKGQDRVLFHEGNIVGVRPIEASSSALSALASLFRRHEAPFAFYDGQNLVGAAPGALLERVDLFAVLTRGLREGAREEVVDAVLARVAGRTLRLRPSVPLERLNLEPREQGFIELMRASPDTADKLIASSGLRPLEAKRVLYLLTLIRGVEAAEGAGKVFKSVHPPGATIPPKGAPLSSSSSAETKPVSPVESVARQFVRVETRVDSSPGLPRTTLGGASGRPPPPTSVPPTVGSMPPPAIPNGLSAQDEARWRELSALYSKLDDINHFELLNIKPDAKPNDISNAYFLLVKKYHPDRLPAALSPLSRCAQMIFDRITEANETLSNREQRDEYLRSVAVGGGTRASERMMRDVLESAVEFQKVEVLLKRREYPQAMQLLDSAIAKNPEEPDYLATQGWLLHLMNPNEGANLAEMARPLERALALNPRSERAHHYYGIVLKRMRRDNEALRHFRQAVELNPRNLEAAREVRLASMRRDSKAPGPTTGSGNKLLSRLFGGGSKGND
jgi:curved DNA-binding protein CbpA